VQQFVAWRDGDEDLAADSKRAEVVMRLLGGVRERQGNFADFFELHCHGVAPAVSMWPKAADG